MHGGLQDSSAFRSGLRGRRRGELEQPRKTLLHQALTRVSSLVVSSRTLPPEDTRQRQQRSHDNEDPPPAGCRKAGRSAGRAQQRRCRDERFSPIAPVSKPAPDGDDGVLRRRLGHLITLLAGCGRHSGSLFVEHAGSRGQRRSHWKRSIDAVPITAVASQRVWSSSPPASSASPMRTAPKSGTFTDSPSSPSCSSSGGCERVTRAPGPTRV